MIRLKCFLPFLAICACLSAAPASGDDGSVTGEVSGWLENLWNLPMISRFIRPAVPAVPLPACNVEPLPPMVDAEAIAFENHVSPDFEGLVPAMARALEKFRQMVVARGGSIEVRSAYRPEAYQAHLQEVWFKWMHELRNNRQPGCQALRAQVASEFEGHRLMVSQKPVTSSDHTRGMAFDAAVVLPASKTRRVRRINLDKLAKLCGIQRPDIRRDPVHFKLVIPHSGA